MKTLILLRHAKASWDSPALSDAERPLKPKGHRQAEKMAAHLRETLAPPEHIFCSTSARTRETLPPFLDQWALQGEQVTFRDELYLADEERLLSFVQGLPARLNRALLLGHNPGLTDLVNRLGEKGTYIKNLRPCGVAVLQTPAKSWRDLAAGTCALTLHLRPKELED